MKNDPYREHVLLTLQIESLLKISKGWDHSYRILFLPSFHPEVCVTIQSKSSNSYLSLTTAQTTLWGYGMYLRHKETWPKEEPPPAPPIFWKETKEIDPARIYQFLREMETLQIVDIPDLKVLSLDGMEFQAESCNALGQYNFFSVDYFPTESKQFKFAHEIFALATEILEEPASIRVLEHVYCYLGLGMPIKDLGGNPYIVRFFGSLSSIYQDELRQLLMRLPDSVPLLMDMSNFDSMGRILYPLFQGLLERRQLTKTASWTSSIYLKRQLLEIGISASQIFDNREDAIRVLTHSE